MIKRMIFLLMFAATTAECAPEPSANIEKVNDYIHKTWTTLTRNMTQCRTFSDTKMNEKAALYLPADYAVPENLKSLATQCDIKIAHLPKPITTISADNLGKEYASGLLYLPHPYVVPGGVFNEMYGWDSYFIIRGLLASNQLTLAKGMVENFFFEIDHYGGVLNANRGYYLSRSQPPFLSSMVLSVYDAMKKENEADLKWLNKAYHYIVKDYQLWTQPPHLIPGTTLSRYYDFANGPIVEVKEIAYNYYRNAIRYFLLHPEEDKGYIKNNIEKNNEPNFAMKLCAHLDNQADDCLAIQQLGLTDAYYRGDRAIRESGLDITFRFGPFGAGTTDYAPVDLNSLLYLTEKNLQSISAELKLAKESEEWQEKAKARREQMNHLMWNKKSGLYFDYQFTNNTQSKYEYLAAFYPLWVGLATREQAIALRDNLRLFEQKGGLTASTFESGAQWDYPFGWAPLELIVVEGLRRYGFNDDANRLSKAFVKTVIENFGHDGTIREKYDVVDVSSDTRIKYGYPTNEVGFGWTNGVFLVLNEGMTKQ